MPGPLIDVDTLAAALAALDPDRRPAVLDVRWDLESGSRHDLHQQGHLPGAVFVDLDRELSDSPGPRGRHPLPDPAEFTAAMRAAGVDSDRPVVVYDDVGGVIAARAWWLLRDYGHADVAVLDGGLPAWTAAGHSLATGSGTAPEGDFTGEPGTMPVLDADAAGALAQTGVLLDARPADRFRGDADSVDARPGHIPGARSRPTRDNLDASGRWRGLTRLREELGTLGVVPGPRIGVYCGSGVTAAHEVLTLGLLGIDAALYPGSWSEWSLDPDRPVATGDDAPRHAASPEGNPRPGGE